MNKLEKELCKWLRRRHVTSENIGHIRRSLFVPWNSKWNAIVRERTAERENLYPENAGEVTSVVI